MSFTIFRIFLLVVSCSCISFFEYLSTPVQAKPRCAFDMTSKQYAGSAVEQAQCLTPAFTPPLDHRDESGGRTRTGEVFLDKIVGHSATADIAKLAALLDEAGLGSRTDVLRAPLSKTSDGQAAKYFVIHDTSSNVGLAPFPSESSSSMTKLGAKWERSGDWRAHAWINRQGAIRITYDFGKRIPQAATKFERQHPQLLGLYIHTELTQPRKSATSNPNNDARIPVPAFLEKQYDSLAILYILASVRSHNWMIPAYHVAIDWGIPNGHDDPAQFDFDAFSKAVEHRMTQIEAK